ncbi:MAG TPA: type I secretion system permease/ATPase [Burkholderiales bacterium]|nr:type I secretion system permease/ATPase [Burkholderiales bacterium]
MTDAELRSRVPLPGRQIAAVLASCRWAFVGIGLVSGVINLLMLTSSIFMMQVYDRVLGSQSVPTLVALCLIAVAAYLFQGGLGILRGRLLTLIAERVDAEIGPNVLAAVAELPLRGQNANQEPLQPFRHLEIVRSFLAGAGPAALLDMPWVPVYLLVCFLLHPWLGGLTLLGALVLVLVTLLTELRCRQPTLVALEALSARNAAANAIQRSAEAVRAMGMLPTLAARWEKAHEKYLLAQRRANYAVGGLSATARMLRLILQSALLGMGAYLAIRGQISSGTIIAGSILGSSALAPIDQAIANWKGFAAARQGYQRLKVLQPLDPDRKARFPLPAPARDLVVEGVTIAAPGTSKPIVRRLSLKLQAGQALGIIGPSASGKSTLARSLVGIWPPQVGKVLLDGATLEQWPAAALGPSIGYLPQDVQLFDGTVAENIARFDPAPDPEAVIAAARLAAFHGQVSALEDGYNTRIGLAGAQLSSGQKQRIGLARALYGNPFLVVLDEPNANLDADGEAAVATAIASLRARGRIAIVIAHRPSALAAVDLILAMRNGEAVGMGPKDEVLTKIMPNARQLTPWSAHNANVGTPLGGRRGSL